MTKLLKELNFVSQCKKYNLALWQCPAFLSVISGLMIIIAIISAYFIASRYVLEPEIVALITLAVAVLLLIINYFIILGFNKLAEANLMKSEFVSIASHQLRTPLSSIKWLLELVNKEPAQTIKEQSALLQEIKENNQRMIDLVNDLLNVSRLEQNRLKIKPQKTELNQIIEQSIKEHSALAQASNIEIIFENNETFLVLADAPYLKLVIDNLIDNAVRYSKSDQKRHWVKIRLRNKSKTTRCEVEDNGVGIPEVEKPYIFQKFFRGQNILRYQTEGTGLGLFISRALIRLLKGKISFESQENQGSIFWFEIPKYPTNYEKIRNYEFHKPNKII